MLSDCTSLDDYIARHQVDGVMWKAEKLLADVETIHRQDRVEEIAHTLALISKVVMREDYGKKICKLYDIRWPTFAKIIDDHLAIHKRKEASKAVKKNQVRKLEGDPTKWPFFYEKFKTTADGETFAGIEIDEYKFIQLLISFGFVRFEAGPTRTGESVGGSPGAGSADDDFQFVRLEENVIRSITRQQIIDHIEKFVLNQYDFQKFVHTDAEKLINTFYKSLNRYFSKDKFARMRPDSPIIINMDTKDKTFFYYKNGFVQVTAAGWTFHDYSEMNGSVWDKQMQPRTFHVMDFNSNSDLSEYGNYADFCWKISGEKAERFAVLCQMTGYVIHDYYDYKLKLVNITDSSLSEASEGRTGKTLWAKMLGYVKGFTEINGKDFDAADKNKYQDVDLGTQIVHLNDLKTRGRNKFDFEDVFNDITEGFMVNKKYVAPFRHRSKFIGSSNKTLNIVGASQRDRIIEFEMSNFFGEHLSPEQHYGQWFGRDWDEKEWQRFDNFMCFCACAFHKNGLQTADPINLGERKLMNHTSMQFIDFMEDCRTLIEQDGKPFNAYNLTDAFKLAEKDFLKFEFDKKQLFDEFMRQYSSDFKQWLTQSTFNKWLKMYADLKLKIKNPRDWRSNSIHFIQFMSDDKNKK